METIESSSRNAAWYGLRARVSRIQHHPTFPPLDLVGEKLPTRLMQEYRDLSPAEEPALVRFFEANNRPEIRDRFFPFPFTAETAARICRAPRKDRYFAAFEGGEIVCFGMLRGWDEGYEIPSFGLATDYRHHRRGHGWRMWSWAMGYAAELGAKKMRITTQTQNAPMLGMAEKLGFRKTKDLPGERLELIAELAPAPTVADSNLSPP